MALEFVDLSYQHGIPITRDTIYHVLLGCVQKKDLAAARRVQCFMVDMGLHSVASLGDHLIRVFASCGSLPEANRAFCMISKPSVYTWSAIISAHAHLGRGYKALELYIYTQEVGITPDKVVFLCILKTCGSVGALEHGRLIHHQIIEHGLDSDVAIGSSLIVVYTKCEHLQDAQRVFDKVSSADDVIWGAMIAGYAANDHGLVALELFDRMQQEGIKLGEVLYSCTLKACSSAGEIRCGRSIHHHIIETGVEPSVVVGSSLIDMYAKCGNLVEARKVFDRLSKRNIVSWGAMIGGYAQYGHGFPALELFESMQQDVIKPDKLIHFYALKACESIRTIKLCRLIHDRIIRGGLNSDILISNALVEVYAMCGSLAEGHNSFDLLLSRDTDSWNALTAGYAANGHAFIAIELLEQMHQEGVTSNNVTYLNFLKACGSAGATEKGRQIHNRIMKSGLESDVVIGSSLIDMYAKGGCLVEARKVFDELGDGDVVSWGAIISAYTAHGDCPSVCELYDEMQLKGIKPDKAIFLCILKACGSTGSLQQGRLIHCHVIRNKLESDVTVGNTIVDMYAKCGGLDEAGKAFHGLPHRDDVSWAAIIGGYVRHGYCTQVGQFLDGMKKHGLRPMGFIFTSLLAACSHAGLLEDGLRYFRSMVDMGVAPDIEHYSCIVDLLSRKGCLNDAKDLLQSMPIRPDIVVWMSLLTSCRTYGEVELGRQCFDHVIGMDLEDASGHVLMWNIYADAQMWGDVVKILDFRKHTGVQKRPGIACIEVNNKLHEFIAGCDNPLQESAPYSKSGRVSRFMKRVGHVPQLDLVIESMTDVGTENATLREAIA